jgi:hypothetical protein
MAKQTFTTGQVLTAAQMTSLQQTAMLGGAASAKTASYVLVAADAGDAITMSNAGATTITANTGLFATGDIVTIINIGAGACTITAGTATVTTSGSLVLAQNQGGVLRFTSPSAAIFLQFATPASGDIEGVTAGTGLSGGGTSGTVTITNSMATEITAAGDIIIGTGSGTFDNLPIGTTNQVLTADTTVSPYKVKWAAVAAATPTFRGVRLVNSGSQLIANSTTTAVTWDTERIDTDAFHSTSSNTSRITIPAGLGGYYNVFGSFIIKKGGATSVEIFLYKNGSSIGNAIVSVPSTTANFTQLYYTAYLSLAATDYIELYARQNAGEDRPLMGNNEFLDGMYFQANLIGI